MKKAIKISILGVVLLFFLLSIAGFLILKTDYWKSFLVGFANQQLTQRFNLKIEPVGINGNLLYNLNFDRLTLSTVNQTELITLSDVSLTYNLKSLIGRKHVLYKLRIDSLSLAYPAGIDSLLASLPEKKDTVARANFNLENITLQHALITDSRQPGQIFATIDSLKGSLLVKPDTLKAKLKSIDFYLAELDESFNIRQTTLLQTSKSIEFKGGQISNRGTVAG
ncbi:MAG: hypothetical protein WCS36_06430, partial [Candidatus Neomarinimicrobiota bacterium]